MSKSNFDSVWVGILFIMEQMEYGKLYEGS